MALTVDGKTSSDVFYALNIGHAKLDEGCHVAPGFLEQMLWVLVFESPACCM